MVSINGDWVPALMVMGGRHGSRFVSTFCWFCAFRLRSGRESAIIQLVSRKAILETLIFEISAAVKGAAGWLARIG